MDNILYTLDNGIRLVHHRIQGAVGHCGLLINAGSANETADEHGIAHFIEHMLFKGTTHRKAYHILCRLEDVGGELNGYTTKEETAVHASFLNIDYEKAIELISDITFHSEFPAREMVKEKEVIIEEINSYKDNPGELIFDDFEEIIFKEQPIGRNILGTPSTVKKFSRKKIRSFMRNNYFTDKIVFCSVGNIDEKKIKRLFTKYFSGIQARRSVETSARKWNYEPVSVERKMETWQCHCIIGNVAYNHNDEKRFSMTLLNNLLGGPGLNSRLNLSLREKKGFAYNIESNYNPYYDTGVFSIYFGTDSQNLEKSIDATIKELEGLKNRKLGTIQLAKAKNQMKGYLARGFENHESLMLSLGKSMLVFNKTDSLEELCRQVDEITSSELLETANEIFERDRLSTLIYK
ncbi:MAG: pitrilysin family protein [Bacteroidales bacterium]|jgi:predicted Zn-dependent peptidase